MRTIIYLHSSEPLEASWIILNSDNSIADAVIHGELTQLAAAANHSDVTLIVPTQDVLLTSTTLPKINRQRLMQALPYALEEKLIADVDELHFAIVDHQPDGTLPVAVTAKSKMTLWLNLCNELSINPTRIISNIFALPYAEKKWFVSIDGENCSVRKDKYTGFACEKANLPTLLELERDPEVTIETLHFPGDGFLDKVVAAVDHYPAINLLQGEFQAHRSMSETKKRWLLAGYATLGWLAVMLFSNIFSIFLLHHQSSSLETQINAIYRRNFPESSAIVAPKERMEGKLNRIENQANRNDFLALLAYLGKDAAHSPIQIHNLDFRDHVLTAELTADKFDDLDTLVKKLTQDGLTAKQQSAAISGTQVKATLILQRGTV